VSASIGGVEAERRRHVVLTRRRAGCHRPHGRSCRRTG
jgi:hypothetical protein